MLYQHGILFLILLFLLRILFCLKIFVLQPWLLIDYTGFLSAFCPRRGGGQMRSYGFLGGQAHIHVQACGKLGRSGGMGNFDFGPFIRRNLVESGTVFAQTKVIIY